MSDGCGYDADWWKEPRAASIERKRRDASSRKLARLGDTFLIVTEGTVTEPVYFEFLLSDLQLTAVQVIVVPGDASDPRHVINSAAKRVKDHAGRARKGTLAVDEPRRYDHVWAVIDTDVAVRDGIWGDVKQLAETKKVKLAHSTPCCEYWLLLHLKHTTRGDLVDGTAAKHAVKEELKRDYSTNEETAREAMPLFIPHWPEAVKRGGLVRQYHADGGTPDPANPSTEVDLLVGALNDAAPDYARKAIP